MSFKYNNQHFKGPAWSPHPYLCCYTSPGQPAEDRGQSPYLGQVSHPWGSEALGLSPLGLIPVFLISSTHRAPSQQLSPHLELSGPRLAPHSKTQTQHHVAAHRRHFGSGAELNKPE